VHLAGAEGSPALTTPMYWMYEMAQASLNPARAVTDATKILFQNPLNPWAHTELGKSVAAGWRTVRADDPAATASPMGPQRHRSQWRAHAD